MKGRFNYIASLLYEDNTESPQTIDPLETRNHALSYLEEAQYARDPGSVIRLFDAALWTLATLKEKSKEDYQCMINLLHKQGHIYTAYRRYLKAQEKWIAAIGFLHNLKPIELRDADFSYHIQWLIVCIKPAVEAEIKFLLEQYPPEKSGNIYQKGSPTEEDKLHNQFVELTLHTSNWARPNRPSSFSLFSAQDNEIKKSKRKIPDVTINFESIKFSM